MKKLITLFAFVFIVSCGNSSKENNASSSEKTESNNDYMKPESTGRINNVVVVVEADVWKGKAGGALREVINKPLLGLPQPEGAFNISTIPGSAFTKMFKNSRNLLFLQLSDDKGIKFITDKYARPQTILQINAPTADGLIELIKENAPKIVKVFKDKDIKSMQTSLAKKKYRQEINTLSSLGLTMSIPSKYRMVMDTLGSFMWMRSRIAGGIAKGDQTNNIIVYEAPLYKDKSPFLKQMIKNRDSIGKAYIRGNDEDKMYMITEAARVPTFDDTVIDGKKAFESRGTWEIFGAYSAGPFLNYSIVDEKNDRLIVVEGFNYAPSVNKRDFVFELEAILKTIKIN